MATLFITLNGDKEPATGWYIAHEDRKAAEFIQYILDSCDDPGKFYVVDTGTGKAYLLLDLADHFRMRRRTFRERMACKLTGKYGRNRR